MTGWIDAHLMVEPVRPDGLSDRAWEAIAANAARLRRAIEARDGPQVVGCAKDLTECVGKVILTAHGTPPAPNAKYAGVISEAHKVLERQLGDELADNKTLRTAAGRYKNLVSNLDELRNAYGAGHGRAEEPDVADEMAEMCCGAAVMWSRWALRRLEAYLEGAPEPLINDLDSGTTFRAGDLAGRLAAAKLGAAEPEIARAVGLAVARRAMRGTFNVQRDGICAAAETNDPQRWPDAYREGAFEGLFLTGAEQRTLNEFAAEWAPQLIAPLPDPASLLARLAPKVAEAAPRDDRDVPEEYALYRRLRERGSLLPEPVEEAWWHFADAFDPIDDPEPDPSDLSDMQTDTDPDEPGGG